MELKSLSTFIEIAKTKPKKSIAVVAAEDEPVLKAVSAAKSEGIADPILIGNEEKIRQIAESIQFDLGGVEIIDELEPANSALRAVKLIRDGKAQILMKGHVGTADYLKAVLNKEYGLRTGSLLSHVGFFETDSYHKVIAVSDAAQNVAPELPEKVQIIKNCADMYHRLGVDNPKIALLAAIEGVNHKMPATMDAAAITMMNRRSQIKGCLIDGPLALDNAISKEAAGHKGIKSDVAGDADLLFAPNIEVANVLYKSLTYFGGAAVAAVILGAAVPVVLTSRADSDRSKMLSLALAASY
ncbi:MAG: bifunctional enoyl-CoA hydratase/phosphate acetyltransferase [Candidatus Kapaibacterium sp.]